MVKSYKKPIMIILLLIVAGITLIINNYYGEYTKSEKSISLIVYGKSSDRWENLRQGADLAASENNAKVSLITMASENDAEEQIRLIKREVENGADALLIAACDSEKMGQYIDEAKINIPVIFVETGAESKEDYVLISADDYLMGYSLGNRINEEESYRVKVAIVSENTNRNSIKERERGLRDAIENSVSQIVSWESNDNEANLEPRLFLQRELVSEAVDVIVTLDNSMTDSIVDALKNLNKSVTVYGISTSDESVYSLDHGDIKSLAYQTEFGIGYIGVKYALDERKAKRQYGNDDIKYRVISKDNMYEYDNQTLLFPFVK